MSFCFQFEISFQTRSSYPVDFPAYILSYRSHHMLRILLNSVSFWWDQLGTSQKFFMLTTELISSDPTLHFPRIKKPNFCRLTGRLPKSSIWRVRRQQHPSSPVKKTVERETGKWHLLGKQKCYNLTLLVMETRPLFSILEKQKDKSKTLLFFLTSTVTFKAEIWPTKDFWPHSFF